MQWLPALSIYATCSPTIKLRIYFVSGLLIFTVTLLLWHHWGMNRYLRLEPKSFNAIATVEPAAEGAAYSRSVLNLNPDGWHIDCELIPSKYPPYCGLDIVFDTQQQGMDLSRFDQIKIRYLFTPPNEHLRVSIFNYSDTYSRANDYLSHKIEDAVLLAQPNWQEVKFPLAAFNIPAWWIIQQNVHPADAGTEFDRVMQIRVATGYNVSEGKQQFTVAWLELSGKWISAENLRLMLIFMWLIAAMLWILWEWWRNLSRLNRSRQRQRWLESTNQSLTESTQALAQRVRVDPLTQALNREGLAEFLTTHCSSHEYPISVIFLDIDYFKKINDQYGHAMGDLVLQRFAQHIQQQIRPSDCLVRWGGEEFILLCLHTKLMGAAALAEKIRNSLNQTTWPNDITVTCSAGVAEMAENEAFACMVERADAALYHAKANGRNRVELAQSQPCNQ
ncbi:MULTISPECIES: GGDEF domain-containing protein [Deefgea]|uniref:diguanylate cyclase n=1 Tax=Deefgea chitinilytica TaxID=570276 RepID=A0ABS2CER8_9NEIS|nr:MULTISPECIES: GGDEF domain-containing protein [Deefgea]MBM5572634.1 diguanylate cyclase [Deefgea chitinilytica]MBM9889870.1 GGDEF domain-containing protein [Deefgea sp. CFH1-16]